MKTWKEQGYSAFPVHPEYEEAGMSLRDWFAGQALAMLSVTMKTSGDIAREAYLVADAMLKEREK